MELSKERIERRVNVKVMDLVPGDVVRFGMGEMSAVYVTQVSHPMWPDNQLIIWRIGNPDTKREGWSHDALRPEQVVGNTDSTSEEKRRKALVWALGL